MTCSTPETATVSRFVTHYCMVWLLLFFAACFSDQEDTVQTSGCCPPLFRNIMASQYARRVGGRAWRRPNRGQIAHNK
ncbi:hypothetical protein QBC45DRAFT_65623 [Copromyces sp. CBS 386.78]|nr:hypothetical protein QBC45DRAFT_65623 [Copromyces sp. CBS 386.78]